MALTATMAGASWGSSVQMHFYALRKVPHMRRAFDCDGMWVAVREPDLKWDEQVEEDTEKNLQKARAANDRRYFDEDG